MERQDKIVEANRRCSSTCGTISHLPFYAGIVATKNLYQLTLEEGEQRSEVEIAPTANNDVKSTPPNTDDMMLDADDPSEQNVS